MHLVPKLMDMYVMSYRDIVLLLFNYVCFLFRNIRQDD